MIAQPDAGEAGDRRGTPTEEGSAPPPAPIRRGAYTVAQDFAPIFKGLIDIPNLELLDVDRALATIASSASLVPITPGQWVRIPGRTHAEWARYFLFIGQGGGFDGTGYVIWYDRGVGRIGRFAICKHEKVEGPGANHSRGWHPGHCGKCGLDLSTDSGD